MKLAPRMTPDELIEEAYTRSARQKELERKAARTDELEAQVQDLLRQLDHAREALKWDRAMRDIIGDEER